MKRNEFSKHLAHFLEIDLFSDYCPNGLQLEGAERLRKIAFAVTASLEVIQKAAEEGADTLVVHHGIFWKGDEFPIVGAKKQRIATLIDAKVNLFAYHLPLDAHRIVGNNWKAANDLGLADLESFLQLPEIPQGVGVVGSWPSPLLIDEAIKKVEEYYGHPAHKALRATKDRVRRLAILSGGGYRYIPAAKAAGADLFITGNFDEPAWHMSREEDLHFAALGHSATERIGVLALKEWIENNFGLQTLFIEEKNPF